MRQHIYVINPINGTIYRRFAPSKNAITRAIEWAIRRYALVNWLVLRNGQPDNASVPMAIWARSGRPLKPGRSIHTQKRGKYQTLAGEQKTAPPASIAPYEVARPWNTACCNARAALRAKYPRAWQQYEWYLWI